MNFIDFDNFFVVFTIFYYVMVFNLSSAMYLYDSYIELSMFADVDQTTTSTNTVKTTSKKNNDPKRSGQGLNLDNR